MQLKELRRRVRNGENVTLTSQQAYQFARVAAWATGLLAALDREDQEKINHFLDELDKDLTWMGLRQVGHEELEWGEQDEAPWP